MKLHSACRALLSGATLLAVTATAAPAPAQPAASPCLSQQPPKEQQPAQKYAPWRNPCRLVDAQKPESQQENDGEDKPKDVRQRLDDIAMFTHLNPAPDGEQQLQWLPSGEGTHGDALAWSAQGGPGSWSRYANPMFQADLSHHPLPPDGGQIEGIPAVPEPANVAMLLAGLAVLAGVAARPGQPALTLSAGKAPPAVHR